MNSAGTSALSPSFIQLQAPNQQLVVANFISQILQQNGLITSENGCIIYFQGFSHKEVNFGMNDRILMENDWLTSFVSRESILNDSTNDHIQDVRQATQRVVQDFATWPYLPCLWRQCCIRVTQLRRFKFCYPIVRSLDSTLMQTSSG